MFPCQFGEATKQVHATINLNHKRQRRSCQYRAMMFTVKLSSIPPEFREVTKTARQVQMSLSRIR